MILARCPACATTFRVRPEQLQARGGRVRCGHCQHPFNALEAQVAEDPTAIESGPLSAAPPLDQPPPDQPPVEPIAPPLAEPAATPLFVLEEKPQAEAPAADAPPEEPAPAADDDAPAEPDTAPPAHADIPADIADTPATLDAPGEPAEPDAPDEPAPPAAAPQPDELDIPADTPPSTTTDDAWPDAPLTGDATLTGDDTPPVAPFADIDIDFDTASQPPEAPPVTEFGSTDERDELDDAVGHAEAPAVAPFETPPFQTDWPSAADLDLKAAPAEPVDFDALLVKQDEDPTPPEALAATPGDQPWPASEEPAAMLAQAQAEAPLAPIEIDTAADAPKVVAETVETVESYEDADDEPTIEPEPEPAPPPMLRQAAWTAGATLLSLALLAQGALVFRSEIVQSSPQTRPFMESLCAALGCELPLPRNAADIAIESSDIQPDATREAYFTLHATLRNRADYPQAYPHLEITLTDARDKALVRKVLEPAQWLPADAPKDAFAAKREVATRIGFEAPGVAAAGYRVYVFYP